MMHGTRGLARSCEQRPRREEDVSNAFIVTEILPTGQKGAVCGITEPFPYWPAS